MKRFGLLIVFVAVVIGSSAALRGCWDPTKPVATVSTLLPGSRTLSSADATSAAAIRSRD